MYELSKVRLYSVGPVGARYEDLLLDLSGVGAMVSNQQLMLGGVDLRRPSPASILFLENGGGKSVLLKLIFSVILPGRREVVGTSSTKALEKFVGRDDVAHVVLEWMHTRTGRLLITGKVSQWRDRGLMPGEDKLLDLWYTLRPGTTLDIDSLPFAEDGRKLTATSYRSNLDDLALTDHTLELQWTRKHHEWSAQLQELGLDAELFRYQRAMNAGEGEAADTFTFTTDEAFVDFLLKAILSPADAAGLAESITGHAEKLATRKDLELEHIFIEELLQLLGPLAEQRIDAERARESAEKAVGDLNDFVAQLRARVNHENSLLATREEHISDLSVTVSNTSSSIDRARNISDAITHRVAQMRVAVAQSEESATGNASENAAQVTQAWMATRKLLNYEAAGEAATALRELVNHRQDAARFALQTRNARSRELARSLLSTVDEATAQARELDATVKSLAISAEATASEWQSAIDGRAQAVAKAAQLDQRVAEVGTEIAAAVRVGLTSSAAALAEEAKALVERVRSDSVAVGESEQQLTELEAQVEVGRSDLLRSKQESLEAQSRFEKAQSAVDLARDAAERLTRETRLGELLDTDDVMLEHDAEILLDQLANAQADIDKQRSELRVTDATDEPARIVWDDDPDALLSPHHEVSRARQLLESAGITSEAGWAYLAERSDESVRAELVRRLPHLAGGVLINKPDQLERAREVLSEGGYHSTGTVVVATTQSFDLVVEGDFDLSFRSTAAFVAAPNPALYDHEAANADRMRIAKEHLERRAKLATLDAAYTSDRDLSARLMVWRAEYPVGTWGQLVDAAASAQTLLLEAGDSVERQGQTLQLVIEARDDLKRQLGGTRRALNELTEHSRKITELVNRSRQADRWSQEARRSREMGEADNARAQTLFAILEGVQGEIHETRLLAANRRDVAVRASVEIDELPGGSRVDPTDPVSVRSVAVLRAFLNDAQRAYDKAEVGDDQLKDLHHAELKANEARADWEAETDLVRDLAQQSLASTDGADAASRASAAAASASRHKTAAKAHQEAIAKKANYLAHLDQLPKPVTVLEPALQPMDPKHGDQLIIDASRQVSEAEEAHGQRAAELEAAQEALDKARATAESFTTIVDTHQAALDAEPSVDALEAEPFPGDREEAQNRYSGLRKSASRAHKISQESQRELLRQAEYLIGRVVDNRFDTLAIPARTQIQGVALSALPDHAAEWSRQLRPRLRSLADDLAQIGRHREAILERMRAIVDGALRRLRTAQRLSKLPDGLGDWTGKEFLRIGCSPVEGDLLAHQLGLLLDDVVEHHAKTKKCDGLIVVLRAVRAAVPKGFKVTMLKPDAVLRDERVRISEVRDVFSGGQHLTAAIILYCTLAALRANDQGKVRLNHSGVLFLDNPIGRASAGYLLDLQRGVAAALGVQLVYTTGLFEEEALAGFPLTIRLRNDADLRAGRKYLSVHERVAPHLGALPPPTNTGVLTTTRIVLPERHHDEPN